MNRSDPYSHKKQARAAVRDQNTTGRSRCGEKTRSGGTCVLTMGHSGGHAKAPAPTKRRR